MNFLAGRQSADILNWLKKKTGPAATRLDDVAAANKAAEKVHDKANKDKDNVVVVGYFKVGFTGGKISILLLSCRTSD